MDRSLGNVVRAVRLRLGWRQVDLARRAGVSRRAVSKLERQGPAGFTVKTLRKICEPLDIDLQVYGRWRGGELDRLLDAGHAALQAMFARVLRAAGWLVSVEVTFSRYGERGSIDLLAFHPPTRTLLVVEIKTGGDAWPVTERCSVASTSEAEEPDTGSGTWTGVRAGCFSS